MATVREIDHGLKEIIRNLNILDGAGVKVGIQAGAVVEEGVDSLDIAIWNHYGTKHIPPRPFMSDAVVKYEHDIKILMDEVARQVQAGADLGNLLEQLGQAHQDQIRAHIRSGEFTANAPSTIARKGSSVPLVDEGRHLIPAVHWVKI